MLRLLQANKEDLDALQAAFEACPDYFERCLGGPAGPAEAQSSFASLPPGRSYDDKFVFGILDGDRMIGCAEIFRDHPDPGTAYLTLLLLAPEFRNRGFGLTALNELHAFARTKCGARLMRTVLVDPDRAPVGFFTKHGYAATGERRPYRYFRFESEVAFFQCGLQNQP
jgi:RimJ/RimL family protein N-acetyltransferase